MITQSQLKDHLHYDPDTGFFTWISGNKRNVSSGYVCGSKSKNNDYIVIGIMGERHVAHRLAWLYMYGQFPDTFIDHINGIRNDNRISNLRICSRTQNNTNKKIYKNNKIGIKNVFILKNGIYRVQVKVNGKAINRNAKTLEQAIIIADQVRAMAHKDFASDGKR